MGTQPGKQAMDNTAEELRISVAKTAAGGYISCAEALMLAGRLGITPERVGIELNEQGVKVRKCSLGCFD